MGGVRVVLGGDEVIAIVGSSSLDSQESSAIIVRGVSNFSFKFSLT